MVDSNRSEYDLHRDRARKAIAWQKESTARERKTRIERDAEVLAMSGASLGSVAADVGLSKSMVAYIERTARATFGNAEQARAFLEQNPDA